MSTLQELQAAIAEIETAVEADVAQDLIVVQKINELIAKITSGGQAANYQPQIDAVKTASAKLAGDNAAVQAAIDTAVPSNP